jgi:tetratricopeptide (TPR) repeat protein
MYFWRPGLFFDVIHYQTLPFLCPHAGWLSLKFLRWLATRNLIVAMQTGSDTNDAATGNHLWADRFDKPVADLFDMQDEIVARLAGQLGIPLVEAEARRSARAPHPDSMDLYFQGLACVYKGWNPENLTQARGFLERALALDPNNVDALAAKGYVDLMVGSSLMPAAAAFLATAEAALTKALSLIPNYAVAHALLGGVYTRTRRAAQGIAECEHALALNRNLAGTHATIGVAKISLGCAEETEGHIIEALRLSPRDIFAYIWMAIAGGAKRLLGCDEEAVNWYCRSIEANRNYPFVHFYLSAVLAQLGRLDEARAAAQAGLALDPSFTISRSRGCDE